jgi:tripartite-type tricarboxylate transporter receptor subunit TctC
MTFRSRRLLLLSVASVWCWVASCPSALAYPDKPVRLIVPFPAGGSADFLGRLVAQKLSESLAQQVIVDNRPGAGGNIGSEIVAKAAPDGYTLLLGSVSTHGINPSLYARMPYDAVKDFAPITQISEMPNILLVNPSLAVSSVKELVLLAKAKPGQLAFASGGNGTTQHLCGELFARLAGIDMIHVPYKGGAPAITDLLGGQVQVMFDNIVIPLPYVRAARLRALAVTSAKRSAAMPELPTMAESGYPGYNITSWMGLFAPAGTSKDVVNRLNHDVVTALKSAAVRLRLARDGVEAVGSSPSEFGAFVQSEQVRWAKIVKESGARID